MRRAVRSMTAQGYRCAALLAAAEARRSQDAVTMTAQMRRLPGAVQHGT